MEFRGCRRIRHLFLMVACSNCSWLSPRFCLVSFYESIMIVIIYATNVYWVPLAAGPVLRGRNTSGQERQKDKNFYPRGVAGEMDNGK